MTWLSEIGQGVLAILFSMLMMIGTLAALAAFAKQLEKKMVEIISTAVYYAFVLPLIVHICWPGQIAPTTHPVRPTPVASPAPLAAPPCQPYWTCR